MKWLLIIVCMACQAASACADDVIWSIEPGQTSADEILGFGWSHAELQHRWITRLEGDVSVSLSEPKNIKLALTAAIPHLSWRRQRIGLFVNNRYVHAWRAPDDHHFHDYQVAVPARYWRAGENTITLRMAYNSRIGQDRRRLALAARRIELRIQ